MLYVKPDFYDDFRCTADECRHSCCVDWEIDIDEDTAEFYSELDGEIGAELRRCMSDGDDTHFILTEDSRCPFLNENGLCRLIIALGEEALCDICMEHPRFYNYFADREERGLGLCCEEAVRLLLNREEPLSLITEDDGEAVDTDAAEEERFALREKVFSCLRDREISLTQRMEKAMALTGRPLPELDAAAWSEFCLGLERLDEAWTDILCKLKTEKIAAVPEGAAAERIAEYMVYRHFAAAEDAAAALGFAFVSTAIVCAAGEVCKDLREALRLYSSEIEYSDENVGLMMEEISAKQ